MTDEKGNGPLQPQEEEHSAVIYNIEDILAEYSSRRTKTDGEIPEEISEEQTGAAPQAAPEETDTADTASEEKAEEKPSGLQADNGLDEISPEALFDLKEESTPLTMEDVVASTVDAVQGEQAERQEERRKKTEKQRKKQLKQEDRSGIRGRLLARPLPDIDEEPAAKDTAAYHKRKYYDSRRSFLLAMPLVILMWVPWVLRELGIPVPFFSDSRENALLCLLIPQLALLLLCGPLFRSALDGLREKRCTIDCMALLTNAVTMADELSQFFMEGRSDADPLGGVAAVLTLVCLWGVTGFHRGMWETFRVAAMGEPTFAADCCLQGAAKGHGTLYGFHTRASVVDHTSKLQKLLVPVLLVCSLVFAALSASSGRRPENFLLNWSVILCAASSLVFPMAYGVPFGRVAARLAKSGAAVAGQYGAQALSAARRIVVTDHDLFPQGTVALNGLKLYGEERDHAISYAATLAVEAGGCLARCFEAICRTDRIPYQPLEHFHIHDENGLSGMIHGETVLMGSPAFMRHMAVRLPATMPVKTSVCLSVDGELTAIFAVKYDSSELVENAIRALSRNGLQLALAVRDGNISPKLLKTRFGTDGGAVVLEREHRLSLSSPEHETDSPNGILYRDGLAPFVELVAGSRRLCHLQRLGNVLAALGSIFGVLVSYYLTFTASFAVLTPFLLLTYQFLWILPLLPLLWGVDRT